MRDTIKMDDGYRLRRQDKRLYTSKYWYKNNYKTLGSGWLWQSLERCELKKNYRLGSFSANAGYYERDVYQRHLEKYNPTYYLGDLHAEHLMDERAESEGDFHYLSGEIKASDVKLDMLGDKPLDIILDNKGALWYAAHNKRKYRRELLPTIKNYMNLLDEKGIVIVDDNTLGYFEILCFELLLSNNKEKTLKYFGERSTTYYLNKRLEKGYAKEYCKPLKRDTGKDKKDLGGRYKTAYITKEGLKRAIEILEKKSGPFFPRGRGV